MGCGESPKPLNDVSIGTDEKCMLLSTNCDVSVILVLRLRSRVLLLVK